MMIGGEFFLTSEEKREPYLYRGCGLEGVYLLNGYDVTERDGERYVSIKDMDGLHKSIGRHIVVHRKALSPKEIKFLRKAMGITQGELASRLGNNSQSVARWEKGECEIPGPEEKLLRAVFLASLLRPADLAALKDLLESKLAELDEVDEVRPSQAQFELFDQWEEIAA